LAPQLSTPRAHVIERPRGGGRSASAAMAAKIVIDRFITLPCLFIRCYLVIGAIRLERGPIDGPNKSATRNPSCCCGKSASGCPQIPGPANICHFAGLNVSARRRWIFFPYGISERSACNVKGLTAALEF
jgi:hypothetical protein